MSPICFGFTDTFIYGSRFGFTEEFVYGAERSFGTSHVIAVIHDVSNAVARDKLDFRIKRVLEKFPEKKSILILNKIDLVKQKYSMLEAVKYLTCGYVGGKPLPMTTFEERKSKQSHLRLNTEEILKKAKHRYLQQVSTEQLDPELQHAKKFFTDKEIEKGMLLIWM